MSAARPIGELAAADAFERRPIIAPATTGLIEDSALAARIGAGVRWRRALDIAVALAGIVVFAIPMLISSIILFYAGVAFAYFVVFPLMFGFFTAVAPEGVEVMTDINSYLNFVIALFFAFGMAFEVPIATVLVVWAGITTPEALGKKRAYVLIGAFVLGMLLTPPDIISQTLLAVPVYILYEAGIVMARILVPDSKQVEEQQAEG